MEASEEKGRSLILTFFIPYTLHEKSFHCFASLIAYITLLEDSITYSNNPAKRKLHTYALVFVMS